MRLNQRACEVIDLLGQSCLLVARLRGPVAMLKTLAAAMRNCSRHLPIDVSDTPWRRAASACMLSPCKTNSTIFSDVDGMHRRTGHGFSSRSTGATPGQAQARQSPRTQLTSVRRILTRDT
jgi:hypothetical protein